MQTPILKDLVTISHYAADNIAYIQGGGGNTSIKLDDTLMAVKASGTRLSDMAEDKGYVVVNYKEIRKYFENASLDNPDFEKISGEVLQKSIVEHEGIKTLRPSVEAGFHSLLKAYVIHTHSVYANILCCSKEGQSIAKKIFGDNTYIWLPYIDPGAKLTLVIADVIKEFGSIPDIIFMENHGVIVTADDTDSATMLHELVNNKIREELGLLEDFPELNIKEIGNDLIVSDTDYVKEFFKVNPMNFDFIKEKVLYPDQLVYLNNSIFKKDQSASDIEFNNGQVTYKTSKTQAAVNEETLVAYLYVLNSIEAKSMSLVTMTYEQQAFILGWESEAYRKKMLK